MKQQRVIEKFCKIVTKLIGETQKVKTCIDDAVLFAEWELACDYEDEFYDTDVTIHPDLTATVSQLKKGYRESLSRIDEATLDRIAFGEIDADDAVSIPPVMDCPPNPNLPCECANSFNEVPRSRSWDLDRSEVAKHLSFISFPFFEDYLQEVQRGIADICKLKAVSPTITEAAGLLQQLHNRGETVRAAHVERLKGGRLGYVFMDDLAEYLAIYLNQAAIHRLEEFPLRMGFVMMEQQGPGAPFKNIGVDVLVKQHIKNNPGCLRSQCHWKLIAEGIGFETESKLPGKALSEKIKRDHKNLFDYIQRKTKK